MPRATCSIAPIAALALFAQAATAEEHFVSVGGIGYDPYNPYGGPPILAFTPADLTIAVGDSVTFTNAGGVHNVAADDGSFRCANGCDGDGAGGNGSPSAADWSVTLRFDQPGTVDYHCETHGTGVMAGSIVVTGSAPAATLGDQISGPWYNPAQSGHGFLVEQFDDEQIAVVWFVYSPDGTRQNWVWAQGPYDPAQSSATLPAFLFENARFPPNFDPADVTQTPWGTITFRIIDCQRGEVSWASTHAGFGSGSLAIERLGRLLGIECP